MIEQKWNDGNGEDSPEGALLEVEIQHCNPALKEPNKKALGTFGEDGFYLEGGGELSWSWDIVRWRISP